MKNRILIVIMLLISACSKSVTTNVNHSEIKPIQSTMEVDYKANIINNEVVKATPLNSGDKFYKQVESFNPQGLLVYHDYLITNTINHKTIAQGLNSYYIKYIVNDKHIISSEYYDYRDKLISTEKYNYTDDKLNMINKYLGDKLDMSTTFIYDKNNLIKKVQRYADGRIFKEFNYKYNVKNQIEEETIKTLFRSIDKRTLYTYNEYSDIVKEEVYYPRNEESVINTYQYTYDQSNNWIKRVTYIDDKPSIVTIREINYY